MEFYRPPTLQGVLDALGSVHRALRGVEVLSSRTSFPKKTRIRQAHAAMLLMLDGNDLTLNVGRQNFSFSRR